MDREKLKEIARQILDYRRKDHAQLMSSLNAEELREITPLFKEVTDEQIAKEREEHEAFMKEQEEKNREHRRFLAETDRFIARAKRDLARRKNTSIISFPFALGEA